MSKVKELEDKLQDKRNQATFGENLTKAIHIQDEKGRKQAVFAAISSYLTIQGLDIDIKKLESYATSAQQLTASQQKLLSTFSKSTSEQLSKRFKDKYGKLEEYEKLKASYDNDMADTKKALLGKLEGLRAKRDKSIKHLGEYADVKGLVEQLEATEIKLSNLEHEGLPGHEYNNVKAEHTQLLQDFTQKLNDYNAIAGVGMAEIMKGVSRIEATEQERVNSINSGIAKVVVGVCLAVAGVSAISAAVIIAPAIIAVAFASAPLLIGCGTISLVLGLDSMPSEFNPKTQSKVDGSAWDLSLKSIDFIDKSIETVKSLENMRASGRGM